MFLWFKGETQIETHSLKKKLERKCTLIVLRINNIFLSNFFFEYLNTTIKSVYFNFISHSGLRHSWGLFRIHPFNNNLYLMSVKMWYTHDINVINRYRLMYLNKADFIVIWITLLVSVFNSSCLYTLRSCKCNTCNSRKVYRFDI